MNNYLNTLKKVYFFKGLPGKVVAQFLATAQTRHYKAGEILFAEMTPGDEILLVCKGKVSVEMALANQDLRIMPIVLGPGEILGEVSFVEDGPRSATVTAKTAVSVLAWKSKSWRKLCESQPEVGYHVAMAMARVLCHRLRRANRAILDQVSWGLDS